MRLFQFDSNLTSGQKIVKNFFSLSIAKVITSFATFFTIVYLARNLYPAGFGKINFAQVIITYFILISTMGLNTFGVREIAKNKNQIKKYVGNIVSLRITLSIIAYLCLLLITTLLRKPQEFKALVLLYGLTIFTTAIFLDWVFKGLERMEILAVARIIQVWLFLGFVVFWIKMPQDIIKVPILFFISFATGVLFLGIMLRKQSFIPEIDIKFWKKILKQAFPMGFSFLMVQIYYNIDTVMLGFIKGDKEVGWYNAAYRIVLFVLGFVFLFGESVFPRLSQLSKENLIKARKFITTTHKIVLLTGLPIAITLFILGPKIIGYIYGANYRSAIIPFQILVWSIFTAFCNTPFGYSLLAFGKQKCYMYAVSTGAGVNIILNFFLIRRYSIIGASVTTIISEILLLTLLYIYTRKKVVKIHFETYLFKIAISSIIMGLVLYICRFNIWFALGCSIVVFCILVVVFRVITKEEIIEYWKEGSNET